MAFAAGFFLLTAALFAALWRHAAARNRAAARACISAAREAEAARAAAVAEAEALRRMLDALPIPVWRRDPGLRIADCNAAYAAALDSSRATVVAVGQELAPASRRGRLRPIAATATAGTGESDRCHVVISGDRRLLSLTELPDRDGGTIGFALDETALEIEAREHTRAKDAHGRVLESIDAAVAIYGADRRLEFCNAAFLRLWGIEAGWLAGKPFFQEVLERLRERRRVPEFADFPAFKRQQLALFASLTEPRSELMHLPDERTLNVSVTPHPLGGLIFVYEDVTDRLALERSYNTLIAVQRATLDNLFEGVAVFGDDGRLKLDNPAFRRIWALTEADLESGPHVAALVEKTRAFYQDDADWPALRGGAVARITAHAAWSGRLDRADGSSLHLATMPLPDGNVLLTCLDITDTVRVERALRERNEALEAANRLKSEFVANISYELRTPLNTIIGFADVLAGQHLGALSPRQLECSNGIRDSARRLGVLINDMIDLATIEAGYLTLEPGPVDVCELLNGVIELSRERARSRGLLLSVDCPPGVGTIEADERRLKQALFNLVANAIRFTPTGGAIRLEARPAEPDRDDAGGVILAVADTGIGAAPGEPGLSSGDLLIRQTGAGVGLSLVRSLIELHGGTVAVDSTPDSGTRVSCRLPVRLPA